MKLHVIQVDKDPRAALRVLLLSLNTTTLYKLLDNGKLMLPYNKTTCKYCVNRVNRLDSQTGKPALAFVDICDCIIRQLTAAEIVSYCIWQGGMTHLIKIQDGADIT